LASTALAACATVSPSPPSTAASYADHLVGRVANLQQDYTAASGRYFSALAREPRNEALIEGAVVSSLASGDVEAARRAARAARADAPAYARMLRAADYMVAGRARQASAELNQVEGTAAEELAGRMIAVWVNAGQGQVDNVIAELTPLAAIRPYGGLFSYQQAMALDFAGRNGEALQAYAIGAESEMLVPPAVEHYADLLVRTGARDEALALLRAEANRSNPALIAAAARIEQGQPVALEQLTATRGAAAGLYGLAAIFNQEHDSTNALAMLSLALVLDPQLDAAHLLFAQIQSKLGHADLARAALARVPADSVYAQNARVMEAWQLVDAGRPDEAIELVRNIAASGDFRAKRALADMYRNLMRYGEAEPIYTELIATMPNEWRLYFARGAARERLGRWPEAEADLRHALELFPDQPDVLNYLGYTWVDRGENLEEGLAMVRRAFDLRPNSWAITDSLGWAYFRMGDYAQALAFIEAAVQMSPANSIVNDHLGDVYWRLGRRIEARFQWQRALTLEPETPAAIQAKLENGLPAEPATRSVQR
jgi:tetratricopeptide (TPR) repeat protein